VPLEVGIEAQDYKSNRAQLVHWWNRQTPSTGTDDMGVSLRPQRPKPATCRDRRSHGRRRRHCPEVTAPAASEELAASAGAAAAAEALEPEVGTAVQVEHPDQR